MDNIQAVNNLTWQETMRLCLKKFYFQLTMNSHRESGIMRRLINVALRRLPKDPAPLFPAESLAIMYTRKFNEHYLVGWRKELGGTDTIFCGLRYKVGTNLPVLSVTYYEDGTAYCERYRFREDGTYVQEGPEYPVSEMGLPYIPDRPGVPELMRVMKLLPEMIQEISATLKEH